MKRCPTVFIDCIQIRIPFTQQAHNVHVIPERCPMKGSPEIEEETPEKKDKT
jgi:hypothetical protein